ncbi:MAG: hypothetical protein WC624_03870 [Candidatus Margulisiibacteriota bacterium]
MDIRAGKVADQMDRINRYSAFGCFVTTIYFSDNAEEAHQAPGEITIDIWDPQYLDQLTHEAGHAVFYGKDPMDWRFIFYYSLGDQKWELLKDSSYYSPDYKALRNRFPSSRPFYARYGAPFIGHPEDNPSELFASAFTYFNNHPDRLLSRIIHPYTPKGQPKLGELAYLYMRDVIFSGKTFTQKDPFKRKTFWDALSSLTAGEIMDSLDCASNNGWLKYYEFNAGRTSQDCDGSNIQMSLLHAQKAYNFLKAYPDSNIRRLCLLFGTRGYSYSRVLGFSGDWPANRIEE